MRELGMLITSSSRERLKVVWGEGPRLYRAYEIDRAPVSGIAEEIRRCLGDLKACWRPSGGDYASALHELASKGAVLYDLLFPADASDDHPSKLAEEFLLYGKRARDAGKADLTITSDGSVHVPWGLVFRGSARNIPPGTDRIDDYSGFWCRSFRMRTLFADRDPLPSRNATQRDSFRVLFIYDGDEWNNISQYLEKEADQYVRECLWQYEVGPATNWDLGTDLWERMEPHEGVIYIFGHSNGTAFSLTCNGKVDTISPAEFRMRFRKKSRRPAICFLNGCWSAVGDGRNSFLNVATTGGFQGFVGAEAPLPNLFALRYGIAFMYSICELGQTVQEAFDFMLEAFWPMSLLYSSYADPDFQVDRSPSPQQFSSHPYLVRVALTSTDAEATTCLNKPV